MKSHFHMKGWASRLALKKRPKAIRNCQVDVAQNTFKNVSLLVLLPGSITFELTLISTSIQLHAHGNVAAPCFRMNTYIPCPDWWNYLESNCVVDIIVTTENLKTRQSSVGNIIITLKTTLSNLMHQLTLILP